MEYRVDVTGAGGVDLSVVERAVRAMDPAGLVDLDGRGGLRVVAGVSAPMLVDLLRSAGVDVWRSHVEAAPSTCCGGCGG